MPSDASSTGALLPVAPDRLDDVRSDTNEIEVPGNVSAPDRRARRLFHLTAIAMVTPIVVDVIRRGAAGWVPTRDAALTVLHARDSVGTDPRLVGMFAAGASTSTFPAFFPAPWSLWWLWGPTRLFGVTWGPLLAMAALNIGWMLLAGWCVRRAVGTGAAAGTFLFLAILNWSLGTGMLHNPTPMIMIVPAFASFLFIAWAVVAGDDRALPALALVANFLFLDHLVLTFVVPAISFAAIGIWLIALLRVRHRDRSAWAAGRRRTVRSVLVAVVVTVIAWLPPIIGEITHDPGNLTNLWRSWRQQPDPATSISAAFATTMTLFTRWPFWFRGGLDRFMDPFSGITPATGSQIAVAVVLVVTAVGLAWVCVRRRDRAAAGAVVFAGMVMLIAFANMVRSPGELLYQWYYLSSWPIAMFVTFALAFAVVRCLPRRPLPISYSATAVAAGFVAVASIPHASIPASLPGGTDDAVEIARRLGPPVVEALRGHGVVNPVATAASVNVPTNALMLALDQAHIRTCQSFDLAAAYERAYTPCDPAEQAPRLLIYRTNVVAPPEGFRVITRASLPFDARDRARLESATRRISRAVGAVHARGEHLELDPAVRSALESISSGEEFMVFATRTIAARTPTLDTTREQWHFASVIDYWARWARGAGLPVHAAFDVPGVSDDELVAWSAAMLDWVESSYAVALGPPGK